MKPCVNYAIPETHETKRVYYAMCLGAILKMYPGMLSAQLLGRLLPEIEKSSNIRDFSLTGLKNNSYKCYMYIVHFTGHVRFRRQFTKDITCEALKKIHKRNNMRGLKDNSQ